ncbi:hypothetical protein Pmani_037665 [Petrolisthes manimaculis]|uniref:Uncharacterized protein n=1 Tax=Petrolisthes manimaculis TaxID=1843537 RepID=A0AAE1NFX8_9EUCA|nr:hypothetical protein Pmani_037665 [Petrolisthes manimaculis]
MPIEHSCHPSPLTTTTAGLLGFRTGQDARKDIQREGGGVEGCGKSGGEGRQGGDGVEVDKEGVCKKWMKSGDNERGVESLEIKVDSRDGESEGGGGKGD